MTQSQMPKQVMNLHGRSVAIDGTLRNRRCSQSLFFLPKGNLFQSVDKECEKHIAAVQRR